MAAKQQKRWNFSRIICTDRKILQGNFENVGYAKVDKAGIYNILIMEEKQSILAAGAGASTKIVLPEKIQTAGGKNDESDPSSRMSKILWNISIGLMK